MSEITKDDTNLENLYDSHLEVQYVQCYTISVACNAIYHFWKGQVNKGSKTI